MAFKEVLSLDAEVTTAIGGFDKKTKKANPTSAEGYYLGSRTVKGSRFGDSTLHYLQTAKGNLGVWGKTDMNRKLAAVEPGTMIRVTHAGTVSTPNGDMHKYKIEIDGDNTIDVSGIGNSNAAGATGSDESEDQGYVSEGYDAADEEEADDDEQVEAPAPIRSGPTPAERAAKVKELLKRKA